MVKPNTGTSEVNVFWFKYFINNMYFGASIHLALSHRCERRLATSKLYSKQNYPVKCFKQKAE